MKIVVNKASKQSLLKFFTKNKKSFYKNLDEKQVPDNKVFQKNVTPSFSGKDANSSKITLVEKDSIIVDENKIANIMNNYFIITKTLNLKTLVKAKLIQTSLVIILA